MEDGSIVARTAGTPQGGVVSPCLANLFLHYTFDMWMARNFPGIPFERYADDAICHCRSAWADVFATGGRSKPPGEADRNRHPRPTEIATSGRSFRHPLPQAFGRSGT